MDRLKVKTPISPKKRVGLGFLAIVLGIPIFLIAVFIIVQTYHVMGEGWAIALTFGLLFLYVKFRNAKFL